MAEAVSPALHRRLLSAYVAAESNPSDPRTLVARYQLLPLYLDWVGFLGLGDTAEPRLLLRRSRLDPARGAHRLPCPRRITRVAADEGPMERGVAASYDAVELTKALWGRAARGGARIGAFAAEPGRCNATGFAALSTPAG